MIWRINSDKSNGVERQLVTKGNLKSMGNASKLRIRWVSELIDPSTKTWREDLVRKVFYPPNADTMLQIKLPASDGEDHLAWHYKKSGLLWLRVPMDLLWM
jgi:hypothetical protein